MLFVGMFVISRVSLLDEAALCVYLCDACYLVLCCRLLVFIVLSHLPPPLPLPPHQNSLPLEAPTRPFSSSGIEAVDRPQQGPVVVGGCRQGETGGYPCAPAVSQANQKEGQARAAHVKAPSAEGGTWHVPRSSSLPLGINLHRVCDHRRLNYHHAVPHLEVATLVLWQLLDLPSIVRRQVQLAEARLDTEHTEGSQHRKSFQQTRLRGGGRLCELLAPAACA